MTYEYANKNQLPKLMKEFTRIRSHLLLFTGFISFTISPFGSWFFVFSSNHQLHIEQAKQRKTNIYISVKHNSLVSSPFEFAIRSEFKNRLKLTIIRFFDLRFTKWLANHVTLIYIYVCVCERERERVCVCVQIDRELPRRPKFNAVKTKSENMKKQRLRAVVNGATQLSSRDKSEPEPFVAQSLIIMLNVI